MKEWQYLFVPVLAVVAFIIGWEIEGPRYEVERVARALSNAPEHVKQTSYGRFDARAEGETLVLTLEGVPSGNQVYDPTMLRYVGVAMTCEPGELRDLVDEGAQVRFEAITNAGIRLEPVVISDCP